MLYLIVEIEKRLVGHVLQGASARKPAFEYQRIEPEVRKP